MLRVTRTILASSSRTRKALLESAGLAFEIKPSGVDERTMRARLLAQGIDVVPSELAVALAEAKALEIAKRNPGCVVVGSDQVLALGNEIFERPKDLDAARDSLFRLRGRTHQLHTAVAIAEGGEVTWRHIDVAHVTMRKFSTAFVEAYLMRVGSAVTESVGAYQLEGLGVQLLERVEGDYFTVLGIPLLPLLSELRNRGILEQ